MNINHQSLLIAILSLTFTASLNASYTPSGDILDLIDVTRLPYLRDTQSMLMSSYDRTGGNDDGFSGAYSFIRKEDGNSVIFEEEGPGCIQRIWAATGTFDTSDIWFYLDGSETPVISIPTLKSLFDGTVYPFVSPISDIKMGGGYTYMPIPFAKSCKIVAKGNITFYQISWQKFPADRKVKTFSMNLSTEDRKKIEQVKRVWNDTGCLPWQITAKAETIKLKKKIKTGNESTLFDIKGTGIIRSLKMKVSCEDERMFRRSLIEAYTDGIAKPTIWSPIGDFFLDGFGQEISNSMMLGRKDGEYYCYFPMPFRSNMLMRIINESLAPMEIEAEIIWEPMDSIPDNMGYFYAWWHRQNPTIDRELFPILNANGRGHWCGVSHAMQGNGGLGFLEGDDMAWIDNRDNSTYNGTGTEDYFNGGWYFGETGNAPLHGCGVLNDPASRCLAFRMMISDCVSFNGKARIGIEHGPVSDIEADYAGVTYWYADEKTTHDFDKADEDARLPRSIRGDKSYIECEDALMQNQTAHANVINDKDMLFTLSGGKAVEYKSADAADSLSFECDVNCSGRYSLEAYFVGTPDGGSAQAYIDGKEIGEAFNTKSKKINPLPMIKIIELPWLEIGKHTIAFKLIEGNGRLIADRFRLSDIAKPVEAEDMKIIRYSHISPAKQELNMFGTGWSGNAHLFFMAKDTRYEYDIELPVDEDGLYSISAYMTKAPDYGIVQLKLDGKPIGEPFDGWFHGVARSGRIQLAEMHLSASSHKLTIEITGKNEKSSGYYSGLDCVVLDRKDL